MAMCLAAMTYGGLRVDYFVLSDLFVVGLGLDLVGAYLVARGLLAKPEVLFLRSLTTFGSNSTVAIGLAEDRVDAQHGVWALGAGFSLQVVGYVLSLWLTPDSDTGLSHAVVALLLAVLSGGGWLALWYRRRPRRIRQQLVEMARFRARDVTEPVIRLDHPRLKLLLSYSKVLGEAQHEGESDEDYVHRVFEVKETWAPDEGDE